MCIRDRRERAKKTLAEKACLPSSGRNVYGTPDTRGPRRHAYPLTAPTPPNKCLSLTCFPLPRQRKRSQKNRLLSTLSGANTPPCQTQGRSATYPRSPLSPPLSLIHISEPTRLGMISYAVFCLKKSTDRKQSTKKNKKSVLKAGFWIIYYTCLQFALLLIYIYQYML